MKSSVRKINYEIKLTSEADFVSGSFTSVYLLFFRLPSVYLPFIRFHLKEPPEGVVSASNIRLRFPLIFFIADDPHPHRKPFLPRQSNLYLNRQSLPSPSPLHPPLFHQQPSGPIWSTQRGGGCGLWPVIYSSGGSYRYRPVTPPAWVTWGWGGGVAEVQEAILTLSLSV